MKWPALLPALVLLAACEPADNEPGPGGVTVGEAEALDEAAEMLEQRRQPIEAAGADDAPEGATTRTSPQAED